MLSLLMTLLIAVLIGSLIYWVVVTVVPPGTPRNIALAILGIMAVFWLIGMLTGGVPMINVGRIT